VTPRNITASTTNKQAQLDKFKEAARKHEADESEVAWEAKLKRIAKQKPAPQKAD
jgi:hypothetical protein